MAIEYDFYKSAGIIEEEEHWHVRLVNNGTATTDDLIGSISHATTLAPADLKAAICALTSGIAANLSEGRNVHIEGLGYFSPAISGEVKKDKNGRLALRHAKIRTVNFRPEKDFTRMFHGVSFSSSRHRGNASAAVDEEKLPEVLSGLCGEKGYFTAAEFRRALHLTYATANRWLRKLREEGVIKNTGSRNLALYVLCQSTPTGG